MIGEIIHVGVTVTDMDRSLEFYRDILGLTFKGELLMEGEATDRLFRCPDCRVRVAYLNSNENLDGPPVELLQFLDGHICRVPADLRKTCVSEICFRVKDIWSVYRHLKSYGVDCLSEPQEFDFSDVGMGKSSAFYFRDPDGIILEALECLN